MVKVLPSDWRDHPIYFVGVGFVLGLGFDYAWLAPARLGDYRLEIADARNVVAKAEAKAEEQSDRAEAAEQKVAELEKLVQIAERNARDALTASTFIAGSPYPIGLESIRIGASLEQIEREVPQARIEKWKRFWSVELSGSLFGSVTIYWDEQAKKPVVTHLLLFTGDDAPRDKDFLRQKLTHALGTPSEPEDGYCEWHLSDGIGVFIDPSDSGELGHLTYLIMRRGSRPNDWPVATGSTKP